MIRTRALLGASGAAVAVAAALVVAAPATAAQQVASATGKLPGRDLYVDVFVAVPAGASARAETDEALRAQGAERVAPPQSAGFTLSGLVWDALPVVQSYNPAGQPVSGEAALRATQSTWSSVSGSRFSIGFGGITARCPSLTQGCRGPQRFDGLNDVGWARLSGGTLGVTWFSTSIDEADMALNTRFAWTTGCQQVPGAFDAQTVFLHENGHVAGLGHSSDPSAVMFASYQTARCALAADDQAGIRALYPR